MQTSQRREEDHVCTSIEAGNNEVPLPVVTQPTPDDTCQCEHEHAGTDAGQSICLDCGQGLGEESEDERPLPLPIVKDREAVLEQLYTLKPGHSVVDPWWIRHGVVIGSKTG